MPNYPRTISDSPITQNLYNLAKTIQSNLLTGTTTTTTTTTSSTTTTTTTA